VNTLIADAGDIFGEMALLNGVEWRVASVVTDDACQLLVARIDAA